MTTTIIEYGQVTAGGKIHRTYDGHANCLKFRGTRSSIREALYSVTIEHNGFFPTEDRDATAVALKAEHVAAENLCSKCNSKSLVRTLRELG